MKNGSYAAIILFFLAAFAPALAGCSNRLSAPAADAVAGRRVMAAGIHVDSLNLKDNGTADAKKFLRFSFLRHVSDRRAAFFLSLMFVIDVGALAAAIVLILIFRVKAFISKLRKNREMKVAAARLEELLQEEEPADEVLGFLRMMKPAEAAMLFLDYSRIVSGEYHRRLVKLFRRAGMGDLAERCAGSRLWWRRLHALRLIELLRPEFSEAILLRLLDDPHLLVRFEAVQASPLFPGPAVLDKIVSLLRNKLEKDSEDTIDIYILKDALIRRGTNATDAVIGLLRGGLSDEGLETVLEIAAGIRDPRFTSPVLEILETGGDEIKAEAARALANFPDERAALALQAAMKSGLPHTRAMAAYALGAASGPEAVTPLAATLIDPEWEVRFHGALALRAIKPEGLNVLERLRGHRDRLAADIATYVISLPG